MSSEVRKEQREPFSAAKSPQTLTVGSIIDGRYEVTSTLGSGGMGEVYEVVHLGLRKPFALKCLKDAALDDERATHRFVKEIRGLATVHSEFVVAICDCGKLDNGSPYFVMERLRGQDLRKVLVESSGVTPMRAVKVTIDACLGVQAVHEAGLVHRDLKPENLFITYGGENSERCKVLDFGIAKAVGAGSTKQYSLLGTLKYMAPEQIADPGGVGPATDVYSLGAIVYECLAGRPPHVADTEPELMFKIMNSEPAELSQLLPDLDPNLCAVVTRALERNPDRRYSSAVALAGALASCLVAYDEEQSSENTTDRDRVLAGLPGKVSRRSWVLAGLAVGAAVTLALDWGYRSLVAPAAAVASVPPAVTQRALSGIPSAALQHESAPTEPESTVPKPESTIAASTASGARVQRVRAPSDPVQSRRAAGGPPPPNVRPPLPALDDLESL